jgi:hypothetical protein
VDKVLVLFLEENHSLDQMKAGMPYLYSQAQMLDRPLSSYVVGISKCWRSCNSWPAGERSYGEHLNALAAATRREAAATQDSA